MWRCGKQGQAWLRRIGTGSSTAAARVWQRRSLFVNRTTVIPHLRIRDAGADLDAVLQRVRAKLTQTGAFYRGLSIVLDLDGFTAPVSVTAFTHFVSQLKSLEIHAVGVANPVSVALGDAARAAGLPILSSNSNTIQPSASRVSAGPASGTELETITASSSTPTASVAPTPSGTTLPTVVIDRPLRSGQQIYARGASLVVLGSVNSGSEVVADGDIYVFGPLIGRVLAGATGNENARIVTTSFRAELASVASVYRTGDLFPQSIVAKPAVVWLESGQLQYCSYDLILDRKRA